MKKFENFKAALVNLNDIFSYKEPYGNVEIAGMVGLYEICFEQSWKDALVSRNNVAHAYNQAIAMDIIRQTKEKYYDMFIQLQKKIEQDWL